MGPNVCNEVIPESEGLSFLPLSLIWPESLPSFKSGGNTGPWEAGWAWGHSLPERLPGPTVPGPGDSCSRCGRGLSVLTSR